MRSFLVLSSLVFLLAGALLGAVEGSKVSARAMQIHRQAIVVDTHCDITQKLLFDPTYDFGQRHDPEKSHVDLPRMREGFEFLDRYLRPDTAPDPAVIDLHARMDQLKERFGSV